VGFNLLFALPPIRPRIIGLRFTLTWKSTTAFFSLACYAHAFLVAIQIRDVVVLSVFSSVGSHLTKCFHTGEINQVSQVSYAQRRLQLNADIHKTAAQATQFVHHIVPFSPSGTVRFKQEHVGNESLCQAIQVVDEMRANMLKLFKKDIANGKSRPDALVHAHSEYVIEAMRKKTGNCAEKALLAGMLIKATLETSLKLKGYTDEELDSANIQLAIVDNGSHGGDHTVCLLSYDLDGEHYLIVDAWLNGVTYTAQEAAQLYEEYLVDPNETYQFDRLHRDKTFVVNDRTCVATVLQWVADHYEIDLCSPYPFEDYTKQNQLS
jgi:hypothetical protein